MVMWPHPPIMCIIYNTRKVNQRMIKVGTWTEQTNLRIDDVSEVTWATETIPNSRCSDVCKPGFYPIYSAKVCCWDCVPCMAEHVKYSIGQDMCKPCPESTLSTKIKRRY